MATQQDPGLNTKSKELFGFARSGTQTENMNNHSNLFRGKVWFTDQQAVFCSYVGEVSAGKISCADLISVAPEYRLKQVCRIASDDGWGVMLPRKIAPIYQQLQELH